LPVHIKFDVKQKAKITGPKVHDVGYRIFLMEAALDCRVMRISAYWWEEDSPQTLICLVEEDEARIAAFQKFIESNRPEHAEVSNIAWEDYDGDVMRISEFAQICTCRILQKLFQ
jgi:acylphosphatase